VNGAFFQSIPKIVGLDGFQTLSGESSFTNTTIGSAPVPNKQLTVYGDIIQNGSTATATFVSTTVENLTIDTFLIEQTSLTGS